MFVAGAFLAINTGYTAADASAPATSVTMHEAPRRRLGDYIELARGGACLYRRGAIYGGVIRNWRHVGIILRRRGWHLILLGYEPGEEKNEAQHDQDKDE